MSHIYRIADYHTRISDLLQRAQQSYDDDDTTATSPLKKFMLNVKTFASIMQSLLEQVPTSDIGLIMNLRTCWDVQIRSLPTLFHDPSSSPPPALVSDTTPSNQNELYPAQALSETTSAGIMPVLIPIEYALQHVRLVCMDTAQEITILMSRNVHQSPAEAMWIPFEFSTHDVCADRDITMTVISPHASNWIPACPVEALPDLSADTNTETSSSSSCQEVVYEDVNDAFVMALYDCCIHHMTMSNIGVYVSEPSATDDDDDIAAAAFEVEMSEPDNNIVRENTA